jgi:hypothetical protein
VSYYRGDYYRGDYYRGDPGFLSFIKKGIGAVAGFIPGVGGLVAKGIAGHLPGGSSALKGAVARAGTVVAKHPVLSAAAAAGTVGAIGSLTMRPMPGAAAGVIAPGMAGGMRGFHISKRTGAMVRNRRMRVTNVRALRRAIRRCTGFAHLAKRVLRFTSPRPPRGRAVFRHRRRAKRV